ncbi:MAG: fibronectin type III domain-containing protein [Planctomycetes bacterium]|nr:fibronectin type III domain-containing protein [Planctomycetota bacterium]
MNYHRLQRWIWNVLSIVLLLGVARAGIGSVWVTNTTNNSITINWNVTDSKYPECNPTFYQVCWKKAGKLALVCNENSTTTSSHPLTLTGLECGTEYKIKVRANTWRKNWKGKLVDKDMREVETIHVWTAPCITGSGTVLVTAVGQTTATVRVDWSNPSDFSFIRLGYKKTSKVFLDIKKKTRLRSTNIANWVPNSERGIVQDNSVTAQNIFLLTGLEPCTKYVFHAYGFTSNLSDDGYYIGTEKAKTVGDCQVGGMSLLTVLGGDAGAMMQAYTGAIEAFYGPVFTPVHHTSGIVVLPNRVLALDHAPGASSMNVHALESQVASSMRTLSTTGVPIATNATSMRTASLGGNRHILVGGDASCSILDTSNPLATTQLATLALPGPAVDVSLKNDVAFVACRGAGIAVVSVTNPAAPVLLATIGAIGDVTDGEVSGNLLLAASRDFGVLSFDVSTPAAPNFVGLYSPAYAVKAEQLTTNGTHVFVANSAGLEVLDMSTLVRLGGRAGVTNVIQMASSGALCFLRGTMNDGVEVYQGAHTVDVTNPASLTRLASFDPCAVTSSCSLRSMVLDGDRLYVALDNGGVSVLDTHAGHSFAEIGRWAPRSSAFLAHLASVDPSFDAALTVEEEEGTNITWMEDMWEFCLHAQRTTLDTWQNEPALIAAGLDLAQWMPANFPAEYAQFLGELDPTGHTGFNIDLGSANGAPSAAYDGAALRSGTWNQVGAPWSATLTDPDGRASITVASSASASEGSFASPHMSDDEERLFEDGQIVGGPGSSVTWTFSSLVPGDYRITTYAWNPDDSGATVMVDVVGSVQGPTSCGGVWPGQTMELVSHVVHDVQGAGTTITLTVTTVSGTGFIDGFQLIRLPDTSVFTSFCSGDGSGTPCPCGNNGTDGHGCANSSFATGALLGGTGVTSVSADTVQLQASSMTGATCVFFQGTSDMAPVVVGDGLGCVTGSVIRLGTKSVAGGTSSFPQAGDPLVSVRGQIPPTGATRYYQCFYRNAAASFCPPGTSNRTNGVVIVWAP